MNGRSFSDTVLRYGAYSGIISFFIFALIYFKGYNPLGTSSWLGSWVPVLFITLGIVRYRNNINGGYISLGEAFRLGFYINLSSAILFVSMIYIFCTAYDSSVVEMQKKETLEGLEQHKYLFSTKRYEELAEGTELITLGSITTADFLFKAIGGAFVSLFAALILKNKRPEGDVSQTESDE